MRLILLLIIYSLISLSISFSFGLSDTKEKYCFKKYIQNEDHITISYMVSSSQRDLIDVTLFYQKDKNSPKKIVYEIKQNERGDYNSQKPEEEGFYELCFYSKKGKYVYLNMEFSSLFEGHDIKKVVFPVKVMKKLGVETMIITNAAGGVNPAFQPSDIMLITDHISFLGINPLIGPNDDSMGVRFPDMSEIYTPEYADLVRKVSNDIGIDIQEGVYMALQGPSYETPAEIRMARILGADAVGMSTVPEAVISSWAKMKVIGISCICNSAAGISTTGLSHEEVIHAANMAKDKFKKLVKEVIKKL